MPSRSEFRSGCHESHRRNEEAISERYSGRLLSQKLRIKEGMEIAIVNAPRKYLRALEKLPKHVQIVLEPKHNSKFIHVFVTEKRELETGFPRLARKLAFGGALWVSWPKRSSKVETDLNENVVRDVGLKNGLVDVKVVAIDETWSGLKFVYRLKDRKKEMS